MTDVRQFCLVRVRDDSPRDAVGPFPDARSAHEWRTRHHTDLHPWFLVPMVAPAVTSRSATLTP